MEQFFPWIFLGFLHFFLNYADNRHNFIDNISLSHYNLVIYKSFSYAYHIEYP